MAALLRRPLGRPARAAAACLGAVVLLVVVLFLAGCGSQQSGAAPDFAGQEKLGYLLQAGQQSHVMLSTVTGGAGEDYLSWPGFGERFSFSNDGRYFTMDVWNQDTAGPEGHTHALIAATDGSSAWDIPDAVRPAFSPDSRQVAYYRMARSGPGSSTVEIYDIASGKTTIAAHGDQLEDPVWIDDSSIVYTEKSTGTVYRADLASGATAPITPPGQKFSDYTFPVSAVRTKLVLTEAGPLHNLWSYDVAGGRLTQVTNNDREQFRAGYLPDNSTILFEEKARNDANSSEIASLRDDGTDFKFLTANFFFDGLTTYSLASGRVAWQHVENGYNSIRVNDPAGGDPITIARGTDWYADPNFAPVPGWTAANPLKLDVRAGTSGAGGVPLTVRLTNSVDRPVEAVLRGVSGLDVTLNTAIGSEPTRAAAPGDASGSVWNLTLQPGESREFQLTAGLRETLAASQNETVLFMLLVPGTPPRMYWQDLGGD